MSIAKTMTMTPQGPAKMDGWHSWRHRTREAQDDARERYLSHRGRAARKARAAVRQPMPHGALRAVRGCTCVVCAEAAQS